VALQATIVWADGQGERVLHVIRTLTGVGAIESALESHSNAGVLTCSEGILDVEDGPTSTSPYSTVRVTAQLRFQSPSGSTASLFIPAPDTNIFMADGDTVDPTMVSDIIAAAFGGLLAGDGTVVSIFLGGTALRTRLSGIATVQ
jgi:hypothetical protein